jgi:hypothetical protein
VGGPSRRVDTLLQNKRREAWPQIAVKTSRRIRLGAISQKRD